MENSYAVCLVIEYVALPGLGPRAPGITLAAVNVPDEIHGQL